MARNLLVDMRDVQFVLFEMLGIQSLSGYAKFDGLDREMVQDTLNLAEKIAWEKMYPVDAPGDEEGVRYDPKTMSVTVPASFHEPYKSIVNAGFKSISRPLSSGAWGCLRPSRSHVRNFSAQPALQSPFSPCLRVSAAGLVRRFGNEDQKGLLPGKDAQGRLVRTMCLTEPGAGSDVGGIRTRAVPMPDGT
jgi:alkylation response protein AidB-like acyl-CoA dehydrogenase